MSVTEIYSNIFLLEELFPATKKMKRKHNDFAKFQFDSIN